MFTKVYILQDPRKKTPEEVYGYDEWFLNPHILEYKPENCTIVTRVPFLFPLMVVPNKYLIVKEQHLASDYRDEEYLNTELERYYHENDEEYLANLPPETKAMRLLAKIFIQIIHAELKDKDQADKYFQIVTDIREFGMTAIEKNYPWSYIKDTVVKHIDQNLRMSPPITFAKLQELYPYEVLSDSGELKKVCQKVLDENPKSIGDYKKGKINSINHLKGQVMKLTKGKADIVKVETILIEKLKSTNQSSLVPSNSSSIP
jgi:Asp-tRNA(Asn)/Glu-tRNA(Gln) amidotransferase B subunit